MKAEGLALGAGKLFIVYYNVRDDTSRAACAPIRNAMVQPRCVPRIDGHPWRPAADLLFRLADAYAVVNSLSPSSKVSILETKE